MNAWAVLSSFEGLSIWDRVMSTRSSLVHIKRSMTQSSEQADGPTPLLFGERGWYSLVTLNWELYPFVADRVLRKVIQRPKH